MKQAKCWNCDHRRILETLRTVVSASVDATSRFSVARRNKTVGKVEFENVGALGQEET